MRNVLAVAMLAALLLAPAEAAAQSPNPEEGLDQGQTSAGGFSALTLSQLLSLDVLQVNVLGTHTHLAGEVMIGYSYMTMRMEDNRSGRARLAPSEVLQGFMVTPTDMQMGMHMGHLMYAPSNDLTLLVMVPYRVTSMNHVTRMGMRFATRAEGLGDIEVGGIYRAMGDVNRDKQWLLVHGGVRVPTGSIDVRGDTPAGTNMRLPYPMQLGSGTFDLRPGITYLGESDRFAWAAEAKGTVRLGQNDNGYRLGNELHTSARFAWRWLDSLGPALQIDGFFWGNIDGADAMLNPRMVPTANPLLRAGERIEVALGLHMFSTTGRLDGNRLGVRLGFPVYQNLRGPQLETDFNLKAAWSWTF